MFSFNNSNNNNSNLFGNVTIGNFNTTPINNTNTISNSNSNGNNSNNTAKTEVNNKTFCNFKWSPSGGLILFKSIHSLYNNKDNNKGHKYGSFLCEMNTTLTIVRKFYNDLYTNFETMQRISNSSNQQFMPDERVREVSHISKTFLAVILSTAMQMTKAQTTGSYIDDEDSCINCNPLDEDLINYQTPRVLEYFKEYSGKTLILYCGSIDSIYPFLCSKLSKETKTKCILIARESNNTDNRNNYSDLHKTIRNQNELLILTKEEYANRVNIVEEKYSGIDNVATLEIDDIYLSYIREIDNLTCMSTLWRVANLFYFSSSTSTSASSMSSVIGNGGANSSSIGGNSSTVSPIQLFDCVDLEKKELIHYIDTYGTSDSNDPEYFKQIARLLVCGCIDQVITLLNSLNRAPRSASQIKSSTRKSPIHLLVDILSSIPLKRGNQQSSSTSYSNTTIYPNETLMQWNKWHSETKRTLNQYIESGTASTNLVDENLLPIINILRGDQTTIKATCTSFLQLVITNILFVEYTTSTSQLRQLFSQCYNVINDPSTVDEILLSIATKELGGTLNMLFDYSPKWLAVHLSDLLYHHPYVMKKSPNQESGLTNIRQSLLSEYGQALASDSSLLSIGFGYLRYVKEGGREMIDAFISHQPIGYEKNALSLLDRWATSEHTKSSIYKMLSNQDFKRKRYASALSWLMLANDNSRITLLSNYLVENQLNSEFLNDLQSLLDKNQFTLNNNSNNTVNESTMDEIDGINNFNITNNNELIFLIRYRELVTLWKERSFKQYSNLLITMFKDKLIPKRFWLRLLIDCVPLLESLKNLYFNYQDTLLLQSSLEEIVQSHLFDEYSISISNQDIQILRNSLVRNLSKSIISC